MFEFSYPERLLTVKGWVYEQDGYELPAAQVQMVGNDGTNVKLPVKPDGSFEQEVQPGVRYVFLASCSGYLNFPNQLQVDSIQDEEHQYVLQFPLPSMNIPVLVRNVFYPFDKAEVASESAPALERLAKLLIDNPHITIELAAHTDYRGNDAYNLSLSQRRAESVVNYLLSKGIARDRLTPKGYGESVSKVVNRRLAEEQPFLHENDTLSTDFIAKLTPEQQEICNALNRRTEFRVLRTTYGLFDAHGNLKSDALPARKRD
jgi:ompA family protein